MREGRGRESGQEEGVLHLQACLVQRRKDDFTGSAPGTVSRADRAGKHAPAGNTHSCYMPSVQGPHGRVWNVEFALGRLPGVAVLHSEWGRGQQETWLLGAVGGPFQDA